jgi:hypothetical protein
MLIKTIVQADDCSVCVNDTPVNPPISPLISITWNWRYSHSDDVCSPLSELLYLHLFYFPRTWDHLCWDLDTKTNIAYSIHKMAVCWRKLRFPADLLYVHGIFMFAFYFSLVWLVCLSIWWNKFTLTSWSWVKVWMECFDSWESLSVILCMLCYVIIECPIFWHDRQIYFVFKEYIVLLLQVLFSHFLEILNLSLVLLSV